MDSDGWNDVLVVCHASAAGTPVAAAVTGIAVRVRPARMSTALVGAVVVALVIVLNSVAKEKRKDKDDRDAKRNAKTYLEQFED